VSGGLAGAVLNQVVAAVLSWLRRPKLKINFSSNERGCLVLTDATYAGVPGQMNVLRIHIANTGRSTAHNVGVSSVEISYSAATPESGTNLMQEEVLDLHLALSDRTTFDLPRGLHRFVDIFYVDAPPGQDISFRWAFKTPQRIATHRFGAGDYSMKIIATAENSGAKDRRINWRWDGSLAGLTIIQ
jgi:hypothetical protein